MQTTKPRKFLTPFLSLAALAAALVLAVPGRAADAAASGGKPAWLTELSLSAKATYDDNVFGVSGLGMPELQTWVSTISARIALDFVPLLGNPGKGALKTFTFAYQPERVTFQDASSEDYTAHRLNLVLKAKSGDVSFSFDNAFVYIDGNKAAPIYALNQLAGAAANQFDKFRNNYAHGLARERRNQEQERYNFALQYSTGQTFVRAASSLVDFALNTDLHNTGAAPYKGYQNYVDRYDINGGGDFGYKLTPDLAVTLGYRAGYQYQQLFAAAITGDRHFSTNHYQRYLAGIEGKLSKTITVKLALGPDEHNYNPSTPISHLRTTRFFGEGSLTAALPDNQSLTFGYRQWVFVASTGTVPYTDYTYTLAYHWNMTKQWGLDVGGKVLEANYTMGNDAAGSAPSLRDDIDYGASFGFTYALNPHFVLSAAYAYDKATNGYDNLPANLFPAYRNLQHNVFTFGAQFKF